MESKNKKFPKLYWEDEPMEIENLNGKFHLWKQKSLLGYIVFVSYNRDQYEMNDIALDDMTFREFVHFIDKDEVNCMNVEVKHIFTTTQLLCGGSEVNDDSVYWFISADLAQLGEYKEFLRKYD